MRPADVIEKHPALALLTVGRWDDAFHVLHSASRGLLGLRRSQSMLDALVDRVVVGATVRESIEALYAVGTLEAGAMALAWSMLTCDPRKPSSFHTVLPQLQFALDQADLGADDADLRRRLRTWWQAAEGEFTTSRVSIFRLADPEAECWPDVQAAEAEPETLGKVSTPQSLFADLGLSCLPRRPTF